MHAVRDDWQALVNSPEEREADALLARTHNRGRRFGCWRERDLDRRRRLETELTELLGEPDCSVVQGNEPTWGEVLGACRMFLTGEQYEALRLFAVLGSQVRVAARLGISQCAVSSRLRGARARIELHLAEIEAERPSMAAVRMFSLEVRYKLALLRRLDWSADFC